MRDKRRANRHPTYAEHGLAVWSEWVENRRELGYPRESSEVRAFYAAQTASVGPGRDNSVRQGVGIPPCKETRQRRIPDVPRIDQSQLGPRVDRHLRDMDENGLFREASVLRATALCPRFFIADLCMNLGVLTKQGAPAIRTWHRLKARGLRHLEAVMRQEPRR